MRSTLDALTRGWLDRTITYEQLSVKARRAIWLRVLRRHEAAQVTPLTVPVGALGSLACLAPPGPEPLAWSPPPLVSLVCVHCPICASEARMSAQVTKDREKEQRRRVRRAAVRQARQRAKRLPASPEP